MNRKGEKGEEVRRKQGRTLSILSLFRLRTEGSMCLRGFFFLSVLLAFTSTNSLLNGMH
jgi:hypothetical protein